MDTTWMKIAGSQRDLVRRAGPELEVALTRGLDNVGVRYSKVILILRSTIHRRGSYIQVGPMWSTVNVTTSQNVRDTCGIETGEHKQRNKSESYAKQENEYMKHEGG